MQVVYARYGYGIENDWKEFNQNSFITIDNANDLLEIILMS